MKLRKILAYAMALLICSNISVKNINFPFYDTLTSSSDIPGSCFIKYCLDAIKGYTGSTAETWANENGATFIPLDDTNEANVVNILRLKKYLLGLSDKSGELDINEDGNINVLDLIALKNKILNQ